MGNFLSSVNKIKFLLFLFVTLSGNSILNAQCGLSAFNALGSNLTPTTTFQAAPGAGSGTYIDFNVTAGNIYSFYYSSVTDPNNNYDWDMTVSSTSNPIPYNNSTTPLPNSWTGGIGCPATPRPSSAEWYSDFSGTVRINVKEWNGTCNDFVAGGGSAVVNYKVCAPTGDLGPGINTWNVDAFVTADITIPQPNARYGTYTDNTSGLNFNTTNSWASNTNPASAPGWNGCPVMPRENYVLRARRTGFPCNLYQIQAIQGDDSVAIFLNGTRIFLHTSFNTTQTVGNYVLNANDNIEIREVALCGNNSVHVNMVALGLPALSGGTIGGVPNNFNICQGVALGNFTNVTSASGGTGGQPNGGPITYDWQLSTDGGATFSSVGVTTPTWNSSTTVPPGATYVIRRVATDGCGTSVHSNLIVVNGKATPNGSFSPATQTICTGTSATLTLNLTPAASGPFDITYTDGINTYTANGVSDGGTIVVTPLGAGSTSYTYLSITDQYGCNRTSGFTGGALVIVAPAVSVSNVVVSNVLCNGGSTGTLTVTAGGGIGPISYSDNGGGTYQPSNIFNGLPVGSYNVTVKDSFGCTGSYAGNPVSITQPAVLNIDSLTEVDASCASVFDGTITAYVSGGTTPYSYSLNNGPIQPFNVFNGVSAGSYTVTVYDRNFCSASSSITVNTTYVDSVVLVSSSPVSCFGVNDGSFTVQVMGGVAPYTYSINAVTYQSSGTFSGLGAGTYIAVGRDSRGCTESVTVTIGGPSSALSVSIDSITNVPCFGATTGAIYITVSGGSPAYTFNWSNGVVTEDNVGITGGPYSVTVTDSHGCPPVIANATVGSPYQLSLNIASYRNPLCFNDSTGNVIIDEAGGVPPYSFAWSNGGIAQDILNVPAGNYTVTVTDTNGCQSNISQTLVNPTQLVISVTGTDVTCHGAADGTATVSPSGGTPGYTFQWSGGQGTSTINGLSGGLFFVLVSDNNGCKESGSVQINEPAPLEDSSVVTGVACFSDSNGTITNSISGGTFPYSYSWSNGATTQNLSGLAGGQYCLTVTDANACSLTACYTIVNPAEIVTGLVIKNVLCYGDTSGGGINLVVAGGTPGYTYLWQNDSTLVTYTTQNLTNVSAGTYIITVTDSRGCMKVDSGTITSPGFFYSNGVKKNVSCHGFCDGQVFTTAYGGTPPYNFQWSTGQTVANIAQLCGGNYLLTLTDANNCQAVSPYAIVDPPVLSVTISSANSSCFGSCNGSLVALPVGGTGQITAAYKYLWSNFSMDSTQSNVCAGHYTLLLTDSNGCQASAVADVTEPNQIVINGSVTNVLCNGFNTGAINTTVTGGVPNYSYAWTTGDVTGNISNLVAGTYGVTVTDASSCTMSASFTITEPGPLHTTASIYSPHCYGGNDGFVAVAVTGGSPPYVYNWNTQPSQIGAIATDLSEGLYSLTVTDNNGCQSSITAFVNNPLAMVITAFTTPAHCYNTATGSVTGVVVNGNPPYSWHLNGATQDSNVFHNLLPGNYLLEVIDANGCDATASFVIAAPLPVSVTLTAPDDVILTGMSTQLVATAVSDTTIVNYVWAPDTLQGGSIFDFSGCTDPTDCSSPYVKPPFTTTFTVTVVNADSCSASDTVTVYVKNMQSAFIPTAFTPNGD